MCPVCPLQVNLFFLSPEFGVHRDVTKLVVAMCSSVGALAVVAKLPWPVWMGAPVGMLDGLARVLPEFFSYSTAGTPGACMYETMCAPQVRQRSHYAGAGSTETCPVNSAASTHPLYNGCHHSLKAAFLWATVFWQKLNCATSVLDLSTVCIKCWGWRVSCVCCRQVCTFSTPRHIAWSVPAMPASYYLPT